MLARNVRSICDRLRRCGEESSHEHQGSALFSCDYNCVHSRSGLTGLDKVRVATWSPSVGSFPYFFAHKKGFYQSEGIDAEIIFVRANIAITALVTDEVEFVTF